MKCLNAQEAAIVLVSSGFELSDKGQLCYSKTLPKRWRVDSGPMIDPPSMTWFANALNLWLPDRAERVLWLTDFGSDFPSSYEATQAIRLSAGETRSIVKAPGFYFSNFPYHEQDVFQMSQEHNREIGLLFGLMILIMSSHWSGNLVAKDCTDFIEFWEGNLFFHSANSKKLAEAKELLKTWECRPDVQ